MALPAPPGFFVPTKFVWRFGGAQAHLCGSFTRWVETVPMAPVEGQPGAFAVVVHLPPGCAADFTTSTQLLPLIYYLLTRLSSRA